MRFAVDETIKTWSEQGRSDAGLPQRRPLANFLVGGIRRAASLALRWHAVVSGDQNTT
jgi:hypothetical protein